MRTISLRTVASSLTHPQAAVAKVPARGHRYLLIKVAAESPEPFLLSHLLLLLHQINGVKLASAKNLFSPPW